MSNNETFVEDEIRPRRFASDKAAAVASDLNFLLARRERFVDANCPACESSGDNIFVKNHISYSQCQSCRTVFVNPRPSESLLHEFYEQSAVYEFWNKFIFPASEKVRRERIFAPRVKRLLDICKKYSVVTDSLLEVGAGFGTFCEELRATRSFQSITALEVTPELADTCRQRGFDVFQIPVERLRVPDQTFSVIASFETLEHLFSPKQFVISCKRLLKPGGLLVLSTPNYYGFDILTLHTTSTSIDHEHLNYFNPKSLPTLLEKCGLEVLDLQTPGELDADIVRNKILTGEAPALNGFLNYILIEEYKEYAGAFQQFLRDNCLSGHMWVVAKA